MIPLRDSVPARSVPFVTYALIGINAWTFLYEVALGPALEAFVQTWGFVPARYFLLAELDPGNWVGRFLPLLTSMFLHGGWAHLIGNMVYLWIFGDNVEDELGHFRYLVFYLAAGVGAGLAHAYLNPTTTIAAIGASGAISGVLGGYAVMFPRARVLTFVPLLFFYFDVIELPAVLYLGFWFLMQLVSGAIGLGLPEAESGVAWWAHVGGFVVGLALVPLFRRRGSSRSMQPNTYAPW